MKAPKRVAKITGATRLHSTLEFREIAFDNIR